MPDSSRDPLAALRSTLLGRRRAVSGAVGAALAAGLGEALADGKHAGSKHAHGKGRTKPTGNGGPAPAKKPKPPQGPCAFKAKGKTLTLKADCTVSETVTVPDGKTLDGGGHTIIMTGDVTGFAHRLDDNWSVAAGVLVNGATGSVRNLAVKGRDLVGSCTWTGSDGTTYAGIDGIAFVNATGGAQKVTVQDLSLLDPDTGAACGTGLTAIGTGAQKVSVSDLSLSGCDSGLWSFSRPNATGFAIEIDSLTVDDCDIGAHFERGRLDIAIGNSTIHAHSTGISSYLSSNMTGQAMQISDTKVVLGDTPNAGVTVTCGSNYGKYSAKLSGIEVTMPPPDTDDTDGVLFTPVGISLYSYLSEYSGSVTNCKTTGGWNGIDASGSRTVVQGNHVDGALYGVTGSGTGTKFTGNTISDAVFGISVSGTNLEVSDNTVVGSGHAFIYDDYPYYAAAGIALDLGTSGTVSGNAVSNVTDDVPGLVSCGIVTYASPGSRDVHGNTFPPPPNEQDLCLDIPYPYFAAAAASRDHAAAAGAAVGKGRFAPFGGNHQPPAAVSAAAVARDQSATDDERAAAAPAEPGRHRAHGKGKGGSGKEHRHGRP